MNLARWKLMNGHLPEPQVAGPDVAEPKDQ